MQSQAVGPTILMTTGKYEFTPNPDGGGGSGGFAADGGWVIGTTRP
ncbi:MAG: hypothetical protein BMS9Abin07_2286 [Acidimicrobiia bacterium]|nr:MAG: hypothetical protein BMS9Abin07_2286 [Acidimicrobiia bacterium]